MSSIVIESEDLENVPLVRMEDVQPSRERSYEVSRRDSDEDSVEEVLGTCVIEDIVYDTEYIVNDDDDSNIGSMVSIKSEEVAEEEDAEMIVPEIVDDIHAEEICEYSDEIEEVLQVKHMHKRRGSLKTVRVDEIQDEMKVELKKDIPYERRIPASSWPTLEILPGGVIQKPDKSNAEECTFDDDFTEEGEMMYACAKCSQSFKFLYCLVKHVKWHEDEAKKLKKVNEEVTKTTCKSQSDCKHATKQNTNKRKLIIAMKTNKKKLSTKKLKS